MERFIFILAEPPFLIEVLAGVLLLIWLISRFRGYKQIRDFPITGRARVVNILLGIFALVIAIYFIFSMMGITQQLSGSFAIWLRWISYLAFFAWFVSFLFKLVKEKIYSRKISEPQHSRGETINVDSFPGRQS